MMPSNSPSSYHVIHVDFTQSRTQGIRNNTVEGVVVSLEKKQLPIDMKKLRKADPNVQEFFHEFGNVEIEFHMSGGDFGRDTFILYMKEDAVVVSMISLDEFLSVMMHSNKLKKISEELLELRLTEILDNADIPMSFQYFSPKDLGVHQKIDTDFSLMDNFGARIYTPGKSFYSIKTSGDDAGDPRVSPEAISMEDIKDPDLILLLAHYMEQLYADGIENYSEDSCVEIIRYDYQSHITHISIFSFAEVIGCTLTEMKDRIPLLSRLSDPLEITRKYIERKIAPQEEAIIKDIRSRSR